MNLASQLRLTASTLCVQPIAYNFKQVSRQKSGLYIHGSICNSIITSDEKHTHNVNYTMYDYVQGG